MADATIDRLKIEVESEAKNAVSTIDDLTGKLDKLSTSIGKLDVSKLNSLKTSLHDIGALKIGNAQDQVKMLDKQIDMMVSNVSKRLSQDLIKSLDITNSKLAADTREMCTQFLKLNKAAILDGLSAKQWEDYDAKFESTAKDIAKSSQVLWAGMKQDYEDFYEFFKSQGAIYIDPQIRSDWGDDWDNMRKKYASKFTTTDNGNAMDSVYKELNAKWPQLFPTGQLDSLNLDQKTDQFKRLCDVIEQCQLAMNGLLETSEHDLEGQGILDEVQGKLLNAGTSLQNSINDYFNTDNYKDARQEYQKALATAMEQQYSAGDVNMMGFDAISSSLASMGNSIKKLSDNNTWETLNSQIAQMVQSANGSESVETLANGVGKLSQALANIPKISNFSRFADGLSELNKAETDNFNQIADSLDRLASSAANLNKSGIENVKVNVSGGRTTAISGQSGWVEPDPYETAANLKTDSDDGMSELTRAHWDFEKSADAAAEAERKLQAATIIAEAAMKNAVQTADKVVAGVDDLGSMMPKLETVFSQMQSSDNVEQFADSFEKALTDVEKVLKDTESAADSALEKGISWDSISTDLDVLEQLRSRFDILKSAFTEATSASNDADLEIDTEEPVNDIQKLINTINQYKATIKGMETGKIAFDQTAYTEAAQGLPQAEQALKDYKAEAQNTANGIGQASQANIDFLNTSLRLNAVQGIFNGIKGAVGGLQSAFTGLRSALGSIVSAVQKVGSVAKSAFNGIKSAISGTISVTKKLTSVFSAIINPVSAFKKLTGASNDTGKSFAQTGKNLLKMVGYAFGVRSLYFLFRKLRSAMTESFQNLAQYSDQVNSNLSTLTSDLNQVKNSLSTAFAPILNVIVPILDTLLSYLAAAITAIGQFFAALTGSSTYTKATKVATDYAASLDDTSSSAGSASDAVDDLNGELQGFNELNNITIDDDSGSGSGGGSGGSGSSASDLFTTEEVTSEYADFAEKIKEAWEKADFTEIGNILGEKLKEGLDSIDWDSIQETAERVGTSVATLINGFIETSGLADSVGSTVGELINTGIAGADAFFTSFHWDSLGTFIADALNSAVNTISWADFGQTIVDGLNGVFTVTATWTGAFDFATLGESVATLVNTALSNIKWSTALTAASNFGSGIAKALNKVITTETFSNLGSTLARVVNTVVAGAYSLIGTVNWSGWGTAIGNGISTFFSTVDWGSIGVSLTGIATGLLSLLKNALTSVDWADLGSSIGEFLAGIEWGEILLGLGDLLIEAIVSGVSFAGGLIGELLGVDDLEETFKSLTNAFVDWYNDLLDQFPEIASAFNLEKIETSDDSGREGGGHTYEITVSTSVDEDSLGLSYSKIVKFFEENQPEVTAIINELLSNLDDEDKVMECVGELVELMTGSEATANQIKGITAFIDTLKSDGTLTIEDVYAAVELYGLVTDLTYNLDDEDKVAEIIGQIAKLLYGENVTDEQISGLTGVVEKLETQGELTIADVVAAVNAYAKVTELKDELGDEKFVADAVGEIVEVCEASGLDTSNINIDDLTAYVSKLMSDGDLTLEDITAEIIKYINNGGNVEGLTGEVDELDTEDVDGETVEVEGKVTETDTRTVDGHTTVDDVTGLVTEILENYGDSDLTVDCIGQIIKLLTGSDASATQIAGVQAIIDSLVTGGENVTLEGIVGQITEYINAAGNIETGADITDAQVVEGVAVDVEGTASLTKTDTTKTQSPNIDSTGVITDTEVEAEAEIEGKYKVSAFDSNGKTATAEMKASSLNANGQTLLSAWKSNGTALNANGQTLLSAWKSNGTALNANSQTLQSAWKAKGSLDSAGKTLQSAWKASGTLGNAGKTLQSAWKASGTLSNNGKTLSSPWKASGTLSRNGKTLSAPVKASSITKASSSVKLTLAMKLSGSSTSGYTAVLAKTGGIFKNGHKYGIPQYAGGTTNANHGSLFIAGESGAEVVGHIGGQTEVLNQSQLAAVMRSSIVAGIAQLVPALQAIINHMTTCTNALINAQLVTTPAYTIADVTADCAEFYGSTSDGLEEVISNGVKDGYSSSEQQQVMSEAVYNAVKDAMSETELKVDAEFDVSGDPSGIFKVTQKEARAYTKRTGNHAFA